MQGAIHLIAVLLVAALGTHCATGIDVVFDEREDLSKYQTWNWLPREGARVEVTHGNAAALDAKLARLIERQLLENGFRRAGVRPDFYVHYRLARRRHLVVVVEPSAVYELSSLHSSPSYVIEGTQKVTHRYTELRLAIGAVRARGGTLWRATFAQDEREHAAVKLDDAVAMLLERFPRHQPEKAADERRRRAICSGAAPQRTDAREEATASAPGVVGPPAVSCPENDAPVRPGEPSRPLWDPHIPS
ncbi:MAG: DUF4136 domain-containing protein [Myxococcota bacterium]